MNKKCSPEKQTRFIPLRKGFFGPQREVCMLLVQERELTMKKEREAYWK